MSSRTLQAGDGATVLRPIMITSRPVIEIRHALLVERVCGNIWRVRFPGEPSERSHLRIVHGGVWQSRPDEMIAALVDHFRAALDPAVLTEFFPITSSGKHG